MPPEGLLIRVLENTDPLEQLTELLHRAYAQLAAAGLRYLATHQDVETTRRRIAGGECLLAILNDEVVGTITWHGGTRTGGSGWYDRDDVATFQMFCVEPALQGQGIARALLNVAEKRARASGAGEFACDTADQARELIAMYERWGYRVVGTADYRPVTNYASVVLSKTL